ncbi:hypothetical protein DPMN_042561 [Dreissena polymorpha]|uniref:Uncharacterized protein n=1 Tax=Dreissena polymorpha TaxID=45954 RepID=A0A9D4HYW3_DREPO|nr:hypothetical protein DPMN_042561 [Dreissena polymorpha]
MCSPPQEVLVGVREGNRGRPDSRGAPGSFKCPVYSTDTLHPRLTSLAEDWLHRIHDIYRFKKCPAPGGHVFQPTGIIFELVQDIVGMNLLTKSMRERPRDK